MRSIAEDTGPGRRRLLIEIPFADLEPALQQACATPLGPDTSRAAENGPGLAGFARGRLPFKAIDQRAGATVLPRAVQEAVLTVVRAAADELGVRPLGRPHVEVLKAGWNRPLRLAANLDVRSSVALPDLSAITVAAAPVVLDEAEIDERLQGLRDRGYTFADVARPIADGDNVRLELRLRVDGEPVGGRGDVVHEVGSALLPLRLDEALAAADGLSADLDACLTGLSPGDTATLALSFGRGPYLGRDAELWITVVQAKRRQVPDLDDEFAARGGFATVAELREVLREQLMRAKRTEQVTAVRGKVLARVAALAAVPTPDGLVSDEVEHRKQWMCSEFARNGTSLSEYLTVVGMTETQLDRDLHASTAERVRGQLVLDALADAEGVAVAENEVALAVERRARRAGMPSQVFAQHLVDHQAMETVVVDLRRAKALAILMGAVTVLDANGERLTLDGLRDRGALDTEETGVRPGD